MSRVQEQAAFLLDVTSLIRFATEEGFVVTGGELERPIEMQKLHVQAGRSTTMNSYHIKRLAIDLNFFLKGVYVCDKETLQKIGAYWESLNPKNSWGGNWSSFKDVPHFERRA